MNPKFLKLAALAAVAVFLFRQWQMSQRNAKLGSHLNEQRSLQTMGKAASNMQMNAQPPISDALGRAWTTFNAAVTQYLVRPDGSVVKGTDKTPDDDEIPISGIVNGFRRRIG